MQNKRRSGRASTKTSLEDEIAHLRGLDLGGLRARWQSVFQRWAPAHLSRHLLFAVIAYRLQADRPIRGQTSAGHPKARVVDRGQFMSGCQRNNQIAMREYLRACRRDQPAIPGAREGRDGALDLDRVVHVDGAQLNAKFRQKVEQLVRMTTLTG